LLDIWEDGGNIDLGEEVETTSSWDAYQQFNELMGMSPYISEEVLISMINNPVFTSLMVKLVCVANPQASRNDAVLGALYNRAPAMPEEYIDDILAERDSYSPLDELRANAGADYHMLCSIQSEIIGMYRTDSLLENNPVYYDSLVAFLSRMPGLTDRYELALTFLEFGEFEAMQKTLDSIPYSFELSEFENQEYLNNVISFGIAREIIEESLMPGQLSPTHISDLSDIMEQGIGYSHEMALALLKWNDPAFEFDEIILDYVPQQHRKTKQSKKTGISGLEVFPNPARDYCTVALKIPENPKANQTIVVTDISGREVYRSQPTQYNGEMLIDLKGVKSGVYSVYLISNDINITTKRLVILK
ncbi:MAG: T9SS type A sorting domain-containing protein, partial [Bacteroidales bacterium]